LPCLVAHGLLLSLQQDHAPRSRQGRWHLPMLVKKFGPGEKANRSRIFGADRLQTREIGRCDASLFAFGFAHEPFESGHVGYPEAATLTT
jgi:hypothetical protein